ncbi:hypothetical protein BJ912DRAFT_975420 [Pholiota molesta]|nr:hypothetical protein BJ912DRAFT_975420 [Pholiota molesta]
MNDPGLQDVVQDSEAAVKQKLDRTRNERIYEGQTSAEAESLTNQLNSLLPSYWCQLLSVCALVESWRVQIADGRLNATSLFLALVANLVLMFNFARRIRYALAQPITIALWYISSMLLLICICLVNTMEPIPTRVHKCHSQSYYYGIISCVLYFSIATLLLLSSLGSVVFHAYPPSFATLTVSQRTLMLQTTSFSLYLALGAGVFAEIEDWAYTDGIYWADYTLLTIGLGSDFPLTTVLARMLLIPYAAVGIMLIGLVISSVRGLVLERAKEKVIRRHLEKERKKWSDNINERHRAASRIANGSTQDSTISSASPWRKWKERHLMRLPRQLSKHAEVPLKHDDQKEAWHRVEFELMRFIQTRSESREAYEALWVSFPVILIVWIGGTLIFWSCEHKQPQGWSFTDAFSFSYTSLLTIGLISVPAMTVFISNLGDTAVKWLEEVTVWVSKWTILPEKDSDQIDSKQAELQTREMSNRISEKNVNAHEHRNVGDQTQASLRSNTPDSRPRRRQSKSEPHDILEHDIEHFGNKIDDFEKSEGREGSLAGRLAREISHLAKDLRHKPPKKYTWDQWSVWLRMLGERDAENFLPPTSRRTALRSTPGGLLLPKFCVYCPQGSACSQGPLPAPHKTDRSVQNVSLEHLNINLPRASGIMTKSDFHSTAQTEEVEWRWTWLGDQGPLFSPLTETEWILEKLCFRLEEVLEDEIREAHASPMSGNRMPFVHDQ